SVSGISADAAGAADCVEEAGGPDEGWVSSFGGAEEILRVPLESGSTLTKPSTWDVDLMGIFSTTLAPFASATGVELLTAGEYNAKETETLLVPARSTAGCNFAA